MRLLLALVVVGSCMSTLACGPAPGREPRLPAGAVRVVPADQVKGTCACDDDDEDDEYEAEAPPRRPIEYVKLEEWHAPPQVAAVEAAIPPRGAEPAQITKYPQLSLHRPVGETTYRRLGRYRGY